VLWPSLFGRGFPGDAVGADAPPRGVVGVAVATNIPGVHVPHAVGVHRRALSDKGTSVWCAGNVCPAEHATALARGGGVGAVHASTHPSSLPFWSSMGRTLLRVSVPSKSKARIRAGPSVVDVGSVGLLPNIEASVWCVA
jgi:hypothetical protein